MNQLPGKILFYYLSAFGNTGGIEKFNRCFIKALNDISHESGLVASVFSAYDSDADARYASDIYFKGFGRERTKSLLHVVRQAFKHDVVVLGHINLAIAGILVKFLRPKCKLVVITHGIEVWSKLGVIKKLCLRKANLILAVSHYTRNQLVLKNGINPEKILLFPNTIDPFFKLPENPAKPPYLMERYGLTEEKMVILTISRLMSSEKEKGYDKVIAALPQILGRVPEAVYVIGGKYDDKEKHRINELLQHYNVADKVILPGFIKEEELADHYCLANVFIMPSRKEGFGIVFLEALACGSPVIGGNQDGSVDALMNGYLGRLINPTRTDEIANAIFEHRERLSLSSRLAKQNTVRSNYRFENYKQNLKTVIKITSSPAHPATS